MNINRKKIIQLCPVFHERTFDTENRERYTIVAYALCEVEEDGEKYHCILPVTETSPGNLDVYEEENIVSYNNLYVDKPTNFFTGGKKK